MTDKKNGKCQFCGSSDLLPDEYTHTAMVCHNCDEAQQK